VIQDNARLPIRPSGRTVECHGSRRMHVAVVRMWPFERRWESLDRAHPCALMIMRRASKRGVTSAL